MKNTCIVSFASKGREDYNKGMLRLMRSVKENWKGDSIFWSMDGYVDEYLGMPIRNLKGQYPQPTTFVGHPHSEIPYHFKLACIQIAREEGYDKIIWLDSSMQLVKDISELFETTPVIAFDNLGHALYKYISDDALKNLGITEEKLRTIPQCWGGAIGFDFTNDKAVYAFGEILRQSFMGSFKDGHSEREGFVAHRHDQAVMSVIFHELGIKLFPYGTIVTQAHAKEPFEYGKDFYIKCGAID